MTTELKPHYPHSCENCAHVGTITIDGEFFDFYRCMQHGAGMTIMRGSDDEDDAMSIPDAAVPAMLAQAVTSATNGEEEAGLLVIAIGISVVYGLECAGTGV